MPLVRLELRNEYGLGSPELYGGASKKEDPKAVLDGVAVSGLVGILRQLGDLAGFAAEVFHGLHEQIAVTSVRAHRMTSRIQSIESSLPSIEDAVQSQTSYIHFAYLPGSDWHANIQLEHDHLLCSDLPRFIMDSYEECRDPPRLFLLDKFDIAGAGACLKRYSDPTYFKSVWTSTQMVESDKVATDKNAQKRKVKGLQVRNVELQHIFSLSRRFNSIHFASSSIESLDDQSTADETVSACDIRLKYELESRSASFDSRSRLSILEPVQNLHSSTELRESIDNEPIESILINSTIVDLHSITSDDILRSNSTPELSEGKKASGSFVRWGETTKIPKRANYKSDNSILEGFENSDSQPANHVYFGNIREDINVQTDDESILFNIENETHQGPALTKQADLNIETGTRNEDMIENEGNASHEMSVLCEPGNKLNIVEKLYNDEPRNPIIMSNGSHQRLQENKEIEHDLHECFTVNVQDALHLGTTTFKPGHKSLKLAMKETSVDVSNTSHNDPILLDSALEEKIFPPMQNHLNEGASETENFMDALNTMDSETDIESELQSAKGSRITSIYGYMIENDSHGSQETPATNSNSSNGDTGVPPKAFLDSSFSKSNFSQNLTSLEPLFATDDNPTEKYSTENGSCIINESNKSCLLKEEDSYEQSCTFNASHSEAVEENANLISIPRIKKSLGNREMYVEHPVRIWTNACLFGVEPSKPLDFDASMQINQNATSGTHCNPLTKHVSSDLQHAGDSMKTSSILTPNGNLGKDLPTEKKDGLQTSSMVSDTGISHSETETGKSDNAKNMDYVNSLFHNEAKIFENQESVAKCSNFSLHELSEGHSGSTLHATSHANLSGTNPKLWHNESDSKLSSQSDLSNGFSGNTSRTKPDAYAEKFPSPSKKLQEGCFPVQQKIWPGKISDQPSIESIPKGKSDVESSVLSPSRHHQYHSPSSPPLENMKISFYPMNGVSNAKLKLEFPRGELHESIEELMFPSFQLLSNSYASQQHNSSESDDDTFCRSSPYHSENIFSPQLDSGSDSDLWELDEETELGDRKADETVLTTFHPSDLLDLPGLECLKEEKCNLDKVEPNGPSYVMLGPLNEQPPPPPLPPLQWRMTKSPIPVLEIMPHASSEFSITSNKQQVQQSCSSVPEQPAHLYSTVAMKTVSRSKSMAETEKINGGFVKVVNATEPDEGNLLYQIRNKSLRRTITSKPNIIPEPPPANDKVTAMLEKATAIRQAFVTTEGGDDNWSDN